MTEHNATEDQQPDETRTRVRTRTRTRATTRSRGGPAPDAQGATEETEGEAADPGSSGEAEGAAETPGGEGAATPSTESSAPAAEDGEASGEESGSPGTAPQRVRRRRREGRGRSGSAGTTNRDGAGTTSRDGAETASRADGAEATTREGTADSAAADAQAEPETRDRKQQTKPQPAPAKKDRRHEGRAAPASSGGRRRGGSRRGRGRGGQQSPAGGVSEETRRAITEGPPRRMLVNVGDERTQIAVLEERDLVEHYVTRRADVSYVGNVYLGRVQNVLPGMEAAFVDIGKGRNGVLYAGEVNYDEADLDGEVPRIEQTLKAGQTVLVQVTKDPMGTKGARLTQNVSIAGRYCVLAPGEGMLGISRKLTDDERDRLRRILKDIKPTGFGLIVRTAAEGASAEQLKADVERLVEKWERVQERAAKAKPLEPVYEEPDLVIRVIRDIFGPEYTELIMDSAELGRQVQEYLADVSPEHVDKVSIYEDETPLFDAYEVTTQIRRALEKKVWLKSGGYLIIEKTEAMWVIDVNTGRFVGQSNLEETVLRNNLEAAEEIAKQLRLRDMGGIIVIDFVDMLVPANRDEVLKRFRRELARDKTKSRVMEISKLGLVQMTRKNVSQGLTESFTVPCECCEGRGAQIVDLG